jgi:hypothetical protein
VRAFVDSFVIFTVTDSIVISFHDLSSLTLADWNSVSFVGVYFGGQPLSTPQKNVQIVFQSREDKPDLPDERARIMAAGGYVHIPQNPNEGIPRAYYIDENRQGQYGLAMSRSLGDWKVQGVM